jgi:DNA repair protein RadC
MTSATWGDRERPQGVLAEEIEVGEQASRAAGPGKRACSTFPDGVDGFSTEELIALVLGGLTKSHFHSSGALLTRYDVHELAREPWTLLSEKLRISAKRAQRLAAAFALGRRVESSRLPARVALHSSRRVYHLLAPELRGLQQETFHALLLDGKHRLRRREIISVGTLTSSLVHPREFFRAAVRESAAAVIAAHNHPSGDPEPSPEDIDVTRRLIDAGRLIGIPLLDHVIVGAASFFSLRDRVEF